MGIYFASLVPFVYTSLKLRYPVRISFSKPLPKMQTPNPEKSNPKPRKKFERTDQPGVSSDRAFCASKKLPKMFNWLQRYFYIPRTYHLDALGMRKSTFSEGQNTHVICPFLELNLLYTAKCSDVKWIKEIMEQRVLAFLPSISSCIQLYRRWPKQFEIFRNQYYYFRVYRWY